MKKVVVALMLSLFLSGTIEAQHVWSVEIMPVIEIVPSCMPFMPRMPVSFNYGYDFNRVLHVGAGIDLYSDYIFNETVVVPLHARLRLNIPTQGRVNPFIMGDAGILIVMPEHFKVRPSFNITAGAAFRRHSGNEYFIGLTLNYRSVDGEYVKDCENLWAGGIKMGWVFGRRNRAK